MSGGRSSHRAFGLRFDVWFPLPEVPVAPDGAAADVEIARATVDEVRVAFSSPAMPPRLRHAALGNGGRYVVERGTEGDHRIEAAGLGSFHLSPGADLVLAAPDDPDDPAARRFLLDTVLGVVALVRGAEALHAGAYLDAGGAGAVAVVGAEGGGKSTLLAALMCRGHRLFTDDVLVLDGKAAGVLAHPGPPLMNLAAAPPDGAVTGSVGRVLATIDGEHWVAVDGAATEPAPLAAVVLLHRGAHTALRVERVAPSPVPLLRHALGGGPDEHRLESRFRMCADVAATVPLLEVAAPSDLAPAVLAAAVDEAVAQATQTHGPHEHGQPVDHTSVASRR